MEKAVPINEAMLGDQFVSLISGQFAVEPRLSHVDCYGAGEYCMFSEDHKKFKKKKSKNGRLTYVG